MTIFYPFPKATLLMMPDGDGSNKNHLFVVVTAPCCELSIEGQVLLVNITTVRSHIPHDKTCILQKGDHPFVTVPSYVFYARAVIKDTDALIRGVSKGVLIPRQPINEDVFRKICDGLTRSPHTPPEIKAFYFTYLNYETKAI